MSNKKEKRFKINIKKGDTVKVIAGNSKGSTGTVLLVDRRNNRAIVEGVNMIKRHTKPNTQETDGGIIEKEATIHISNLMLVDSKTGDPTRVGRKKVDGKLVRYSKKTGDLID